MTVPIILPSAFPIYVGPSTIPGAVRGVFASRNIKKDELIESCPLVFFPLSEEQHMKKTVVWKYYFEWTRQHHVIVLGYGSLYNHSFSPNAKYSHDYRKKLLVFRAIKLIQKDEEITVNYNWYPHSTEQLDPVHGIPNYANSVMAE